MIRYVPGAKLVELKSLRDHLAGYRNRQIFQEEAVNEVLDELVAALEPRWIEVEGSFNARGAMTTCVVAQHGQEP